MSRQTQMDLARDVTGRPAQCPSDPQFGALRGRPFASEAAAGLVILGPRLGTEPRRPERLPGLAVEDVARAALLEVAWRRGH